MLMTVAVHNLARGMIFIRLWPSFLDLCLVRELSDPRPIHWNIAKPAYMVPKVAE